MMNRREFLRDAVLVVGGLVASELLVACGAARTKEQDEANHAVVTKLKVLIGATPSSTRLELGKAHANKLFDPNWLVKQSLGTVYSDTGTAINYQLDERGEYIFGVIDVAEDFPMTPVFTGLTRFEYGKYVFAAYGEKEKVKTLIQNNSKTIEMFLRHYYHDTVADKNVFHAVLTAGNARFILHTEPSINPSETRQLGNSSALLVEASTVTDRRGNRIHRSDVFTKPAITRLIARRLGFTLSTDYLGGISNEMANVIQRQQFQGNYNEALRGNEAFSTIIDLIARFDDSFANMWLGGTAYKDFIRMITQYTNNNVVAIPKPYAISQNKELELVTATNSDIMVFSNSQWQPIPV